MRKFWCLLVLLLAVLASTDTLHAQSFSGTLNDSLCGGPLRPRRGTYIIQSFPTPAKAGSTVNIKVYNHNPDVFSVRIVGVLDRTMMVLQEKQATLNGVHSFSLPSGALASGKSPTAYSAPLASLRARL